MAIRTGKLILFTILIIALLLQAFACATPLNGTTARVIRVIDGDTIVIERNVHVRYIGMDTPEMLPEPVAFAVAATQTNRSLVEGKIVRLVKDVSEIDKYDRLLRYVYVDDTFVNAELVRLGLASAKAYPPDTRYQSLFEKMEAEAKAAKRGMWGQ